MKICPKCNTTHEKSGTYCSRSCANSRGPRTELFKSKVSEKLKGRKVAEDIKKKITGELNGSWKGGITLSPKTCNYCKKEYFGQQKTKFCGKECWKKQCASDKSDFQKYRIDCNFKFNIYDFSEEFNLELIREHGLYSAKNRGNNLNGVSRDHRISVRFGFDNKIDSNIISHPANCEIMQHAKNSSKRTKNSISLTELLENIKTWDKKYGGMTER